MKRNWRVVAIFMSLILILAACNLPRETATPNPNEPNLISTSAAQTVQALGTQLALPTSTQLAVTTVPENPTQTEPSSTPTTQPSIAPVATATQLPPTPTPLPCDRVRFIADVTIPDGTSFSPGAGFTKTWELENAGSCTWNSNYSLVFANEGNAMNGPASKQLTSGTVAPGKRVQVSLDLKAPTTPGEYTGYWKLRNASGMVFGIGANDSAFTVAIKVSGTTYNFAEKYCSATWTSAAGTLPCPGNASDSTGFIARLDAPTFENGSKEDEWAIWTNPQFVENGEIRGTYPAITVSSGNRFKTIIGCQVNANNCNVKFQLNYRADGGSEQTFAEWAEKYDNNWTRVDLDLTSLAGKSVQFILVVKANGPSDQDQALWLLPRIQ